MALEEVRKWLEQSEKLGNNQALTLFPNADGPTLDASGGFD